MGTKNQLVKLFTAERYIDLKNLAITFETAIYEYYKDVNTTTMTIQGVKSRRVEIEHLEKSGVCEIYDKYVTDCKADLPPEHCAIQLEFYYDSIEQPELENNNIVEDESDDI